MEVIEQKRPGWRGLKQAQVWLRSLERYAFPRIGKRPVAEVVSADVLQILAPIWHVRMQNARTVRLRISAVLEWAVAMNLRNGRTSSAGRTERGGHRAAAPNTRSEGTTTTIRGVREGPTHDDQRNPNRLAHHHRW